MAFSYPAGTTAKVYREARRLAVSSKDCGSDSRGAFERDRDRILYSTAFRRLAVITQVVGPNEGYAFHNRLTHVLKVAQIGRRLAEKLLQSTDADLIEQLGGLDPFVVEAAALAHDLGHPPFGHVAEKELQRLATEAGLKDSFEGNAQSFRVVTKLEVREADEQRPGLGLTRATLNAILKYPFFKAETGKAAEKWGAYESERTDLFFARQREGCSSAQSLEAALMDWADDIAYSVHDMEDFYRAGMLPLDRLYTQGDARASFLDGVYRRLKICDLTERRLYESVASDLFEVLPSDRFEGRRDQTAFLRSVVSDKIAKYEDATTIGNSGIQKSRNVEVEVALLKQLVWQYVIENPLLGTQQHGQMRIISDLFGIYIDASSGKRGRERLAIFPPLLRDDIENEETRIRAIVDLIAGYTEAQVVDMHHRLTGSKLGSAFRV